MQDYGYKHKAREEPKIEINIQAIEITLLEYSIKKKESEAITNPEANPSKPSIQLNAFTSAVIQKTVIRKLSKGGG